MSDSNDDPEIVALKAELRSQIERAEATFNQAVQLKAAWARRYDWLEERQRLWLEERFGQRHPADHFAPGNLNILN